MLHGPHSKIDGPVNMASENYLDFCLTMEKSTWWRITLLVSVESISPWGVSVA